MRAVNLIPSEQRAGAGGTMGRSEGAVYVLLGFIVCFALLLVLYGKARHQAAARKAEAAALNAKAQRAQEAMTGLSPYVNFLALREAREQAVSQLVDSRFDWAHVFHELGRVLPPGETSVTSLSGSVGGSPEGGASKGASSSGSGSAGAASSSSSGGGPASSSGSGSSGAAVSSATPPGSVPNFTLSGCATTQAIVALALTRLRLIDGVNEVTLQSSTTNSSAPGGAGAGASGGCGRGPAFTIGLTFQPLPSVNEARAAAVTRDVASGGSR